MVLVGAGAYLALLEVSYRLLESSYAPPQWWRVRPKMSWFALINAAGAVLAALPVALGLVLFVKKQRLAIGLLVGVPPSLYIMGSGLATYGLPKYTAAWVIDVLQFLSIGLAVLLVVILCSRLPRAIGSSDRGVASSVNEGGSRRWK
jgi:hypothetical protein